MSKAITLTADEATLWFAERAQTGFLVALWLNPDTAAQLAVPKGEPADNLHVTLCMCGDASEMGDLAVYRTVAAIERAVQWWGTVEGTVSGYGRFNPTDSSDEQSVFYASVDILGLTELRQRVMDALYEAGTPPQISHGYTPHCTLAYLPADAANPIESVPSVKLTFDGVTVMVGSKRIDVPFVPPGVVSMGDASAAAPPRASSIRPLLFSMTQEWIPFLPVPGRYEHSLYGTLDFSPERYRRIVENFDAGIYPQDLPITVEHDSHAAGAVGWIRPGGMRLAADGSIEVKPEWNTTGRDLIEGDRFRYVSAEVAFQWQHPTTREWHQDVAVGHTICLRPHFKVDTLRPLAASEGAALAMAASFVMAGDPGKESGMTEEEKAAAAAATAAAAKPAETTDDDAVKQLTERIMAELGGTTKITDPVVQEFVQKAALELTEARAQAKREADRAKTLTEQNAVLQAQNRVKTFTDEVMGHGPHSAIAYVGHIPDHVRMLCSLANTYGDTSWEVETYKSMNRAHAEQIKAGSLFKEIGTARGSDATQTAEDQIDALARELTARTPGLTHAQAFTQVLNSNAELRAAHARERRA